MRSRAMGAMTPISQTSPIGTPAVGSSVDDDRARRPSFVNTARCFFVPHVASVEAATRAGVRAACRPGVVRISAGNYGGKLGPFHLHLHKLLAPT